MGTPPSTAAVGKGTPPRTGGVFERDSLCLSLAVAGRRGEETVNAVEGGVVLLFFIFELRVELDPERERVSVVRWSSNIPSSSSSSNVLKSGSV